MIAQKDFTLISTKNGISLFQTQSKNRNELSLVVQITDKGQGTCRKYYKTIRQVQSLGKIKQFCSSLHILLQYLKKPQNFELDIQNKVLYIVCKNMMNSEETLRIGQIHLNDNSEWDIEQFREKLQYIQQSANQNSQEFNVKNLFGSIAYCLEYLVNRRQSDGNIKTQVLECKQLIQQKSKKTTQNIQNVKKQFKNLSTNVYQFFLKQHGQLIQLIQSQTKHTNQKLKKIHQNKESLRMDIQKFKLCIESKISEHNNQIIQSNKHQILKEQFQHQHKKVQNVKKQLEQVQIRFIKKIKQLSLLSMQTSRRISIMQQDLYRLKKQNRGSYSQKVSNEKIPSQKSQDYHENYLEQQGHVEPVTALVWTNYNSQYYDKIQFAKNMIKNKRDGSITVFGKKINHSSYVYVVKIDKLKKSIALGFIDVQYIKGQFVGPNLIYIGKKGKCYISGKEENSQIIFNEGDTIQISVNFSKSTVSWKKNRQKKYQISCQLLKQSNQNKITWVPYILMSSKNDTVYVFD